MQHIYCQVTELAFFWSCQLRYWYLIPFSTFLTSVNISVLSGLLGSLFSLCAAGLSLNIDTYLLLPLWWYPNPLHYTVTVVLISILDLIKGRIRDITSNLHFSLFKWRPEWHCTSIFLEFDNSNFLKAVPQGKRNRRGIRKYTWGTLPIIFITIAKRSDFSLREPVFEILNNFKISASMSHFFRENKFRCRS